MESEVPENHGLASENTLVQENSKSTKSENRLTVASVAVFILFSLATVGFLYNQNKELKKIVAEYQRPTPSPVAIASPTPDPATQVVVQTPQKDSLVTSPLTVKGTLPAGWMFEGVAAIKLMDTSGKLIKQGQAKEVNPGSWLSGNPVEFTSSITFKTSTASGVILIESDNASGDPQKVKYFSLPVRFTDSSVSTQTPGIYTCPQNGYVDCMPGPDSEGIKFSCTPEAINWYKANCPDFKGVAY